MEYGGRELNRLDRIERLIEQSARANKAAQAANKAAHATINRDLRRWAALGVQEARRQRKRAREIDDNISRLVTAQLETEQTLKGVELALRRFIEGRNGNGHR